MWEWCQSDRNWNEREDGCNRYAIDSEGKEGQLLIRSFRILGSFRPMTKEEYDAIKSRLLYPNDERIIKGFSEIRKLSESVKNPVIEVDEEILLKFEGDYEFDSIVDFFEEYEPEEHKIFGIHFQNYGYDDYPEYFFIGVIGENKVTFINPLDDFSKIEFDNAGSNPEFFNFLLGDGSPMNGLDPYTKEFYKDFDTFMKSEAELTQFLDAFQCEFYYQWEELGYQFAPSSKKKFKHPKDIAKFIYNEVNKYYENII